MKFSTIVPHKCTGLIQMHKEANMTLTYKGQMSKYDNYFSNFGRSPVPNDLCKYLAPRHPRFWRRRFLKIFFTIYGHGSHLGQWTTTISAIFCSPNLRRVRINLAQWLQRRSPLKYSTTAHTNVMGLIQMQRKANLTLP